MYSIQSITLLLRICFQKRTFFAYRIDPILRGRGIQSNKREVTKAVSGNHLQQTVQYTKHYFRVMGDNYENLPLLKGEVFFKRKEFAFTVDPFPQWPGVQ